MTTTAPIADGRRGLAALALAGALTAGALGPAAASSPSAAAPELSRVVVTATAGGLAGAQAAAQAVVAAGGRVLSSLPLVGGVGAELPSGATLAPSYAVVPDRVVTLAGPADAATGPASSVRETLGLGAPAGEGAGVTVAVVDTGVAEVGDLAGRVTHVDVTGAGGDTDAFGHGTFVAGLVAGDGSASGGRYAGIAPAASVLDVKVARADGTTDLITVLRGLQEVAVRDVDVLNLSLSSASPLSYDRDPLAMGLGALWDSGVTVVVPAGNDGPRSGTISSPGVHPTLLTVGAVDEAGTGDRADDTVAAFSGRGPAPKGAAKPELVAPGRSVVSLRAPGSVIDGQNAAARVGEAYFTGSGTSFSTAVTAGAAAALLGEHDLLPPQLKGLLVTTAYDAAGLGEPKAAGAGGLDVAAAFALAGSTPAPPPPAERPKPGKGSGKGAPVAPDANSWSANSWSANSWSANSWSANSWSANSWSANSWSAQWWSANSWSANSWSANSWSANSWSANSWSANSWSANSWSANSWSAHTWGAPAAGRR